MKRFVAGADRGQSTLLPECLDDWVDESNPVHVIDAFVDALDLGELGFSGVEPAVSGRPSYHPSVLLKLYIYGYLNRLQSSRRLEREAGRNLEVMWLIFPRAAIASILRVSIRSLRQVRIVDCPQMSTYPARATLGATTEKSIKWPFAIKTNRLN